MRNNIYNYINNTISIILIALAGITPLLFLNLTTDYYDIPKLILLVTATIILLGLWIISWIAQGKIVITRTPLDVPLVLLLATIIASTIFSTAKNASIYGVFPEVHGSAVSWVSYILLYFITVSHLKKVNHIKLFLHALYGSACLVALISLLSYFKVFLPFEMAKGVNFSTTGSTFSTVALLLMLLPLPLISIASRNKQMPQVLAVAVAVLFSMTIALIGTVPTYILLFLVFALSLFIVRPHLNGNSFALLLTPLVLSILLLVFSYLPFSGNKLQIMRSNFPVEIQLPFNISWKVAATAFRDAPFLGTGPSTFVYNFTNYKPTEFNQLRYWSFSFSTAYNELLQVLSTWGLVGLAALIAFAIVIIIFSRKYLLTSNREESADDSHVLLPALALSSLLAIALLFVHTTTLVSVVSTLFLAAAFMMSQRNIREKVSEFSIGVKVSTADNKQLDFLPILVFILFLIAAVPVVRKTYNAVAADYYHRLALSQASKDGTLTYQYLQKAETLNPYIDLYRVDMAQTNFALANALAAQKGPTKDNPQGTLTDNDKQTIQTLVTQAINEGRASVVLSPRSSRNWEVLALIYRNITGVAKNSLTFSLDAYGRSIQMDPLNPALRVNVGSVYHATKNYDMAVRYYSDAINLKPDYVNGYYNLAIALRDKNDLQNAKLVAEQAVSLLKKDLSSNDYKTASDLLKEISDKIDAGTTTQTTTNNTNNQTEALQNPNLPNINVPDMNNPPETTTPASVEGNPNAVLPKINVSATPTIKP
jgi:tetratricopeptide (TPR) repeat protein